MQQKYSLHMFLQKIPGKSGEETFIFHLANLVFAFWIQTLNHAAWKYLLEKIEKIISNYKKLHIYYVSARITLKCAKKQGQHNS